MLQKFFQRNPPKFGLALSSVFLCLELWKFFQRNPLKFGLVLSFVFLCLDALKVFSKESSKVWPCAFICFLVFGNPDETQCKSFWNSTSNITPAKLSPQTSRFVGKNNYLNMETKFISHFQYLAGQCVSLGCKSQFLLKIRGVGSTGVMWHETKFFYSQAETANTMMCSQLGHKNAYWVIKIGGRFLGYSHVDIWYRLWNIHICNLRIVI